MTSFVPGLALSPAAAAFSDCGQTAAQHCSAVAYAWVYSLARYALMVLLLSSGELLAADVRFAPSLSSQQRGKTVARADADRSAVFVVNSRTKGRWMPRISSTPITSLAGTTVTVTPRSPKPSLAEGWPICGFRPVTYVE